MAGARCASCDAAIDKGTQCDECAAGMAATVISSGEPTAAGVPSAKAGKPGDPLIGVEVIGQYVIRSQLGKGGMGAVYLADQPSVGRRAVIKVLHPKHSRDPDIQSRFETEARAASQLNHPNIVTIYNYGAMADGTLFLAMEHLDGHTLDEVSGKRRMPLPRIVNIVCQIAEALGEAHRRGVIHRDVKPTNVMLVARGETDDFVKVLDFGIAQIEGTRLTATGEICGTPTYMSPEQVRGNTLDGRSDLYSLGCMVLELVTGHVPFSGSNSLGLAYSHVHEAAPRASELAPKANVPAKLDAFLARVLAKNPDDRPRDAAVFRDELRSATAPEPAGAVPKPVARAESKPVVRAESRAVARTESKLARADARQTPKPFAKPKQRISKPMRAQRPGVLRRGMARLGAAVRGTGSFFRRRKTFGQRFAARLRSFGARTPPSARWLRFAIACGLALSLAGLGWLVATHTRELQWVVHPTVKPAPSPQQPPRPLAKPARPKRQASTKPH